MSDRLGAFKQIIEDAVETTNLWTSMKADLERCRQKIERLRSELSWASDPAAAVEILNTIRYIDYTAHQYQAQLDRFPGKLADLKQRCTFLALTPKEARQAGRRGELN